MCSYIEENNKAITNLKKEKIIEISKKITEEENKEKELVLSKNKSRIEQYKDLKKVLEEIAAQKIEEPINRNLSKTKKL